MKTAFLLACVVVGGCSCQRLVCDNEKRERLIMECLDRTPKVTNAGEDVNLGGAVWPCRAMADELSCWMEDDYPWSHK